MRAIKLSKDARKLLRLASREHIEVTPDNLEAYRELAQGGGRVMYPCSGLHESVRMAVFRFTEEGWNRREELQRSRFAPSAMLRRILRAFSPMGSSVSDPEILK